VGENDQIVVTVWDKDLLKKDDFMGEVRLYGRDIVHGEERWYALQSRDYRYDRVHGEICLRFACYYS
jgi:hypothetical protein